MRHVDAYVFVEADVGTAGDVAREMGRLPGLRSADEVVGPYDVIARAEVADARELARLVVNEIQTIQGVTRTVTCMVGGRVLTPA